MKQSVTGDGTALGLTLGEASKQTGKSKATLSRAIKTGKISASKNDDGSFAIEPAELFRVYKRAADATSETDKNAENDTPRNTIATPEKDIEIATLRAELHAAREKIDDLQQMTADIKEDRDNWRQQATRLLTHQPNNSGGLFRRFFGKN